jgi:hypothetical protein
MYHICRWVFCQHYYTLLHRITIQFLVVAYKTNVSAFDRQCEIWCPVCSKQLLIQLETSAVWTRCDTYNSSVLQMSVPLGLTWYNSQESSPFDVTHFYNICISIFNGRVGKQQPISWIWPIASFMYVQRISVMLQIHRTCIISFQYLLCTIPLINKGSQ